MLKKKLTSRLAKKNKSLKRWRDSKSCEDCGATKNLTFHHIVHKNKGGVMERRNLIILCRKCHNEEHEHHIKLESRQERNR